ncbi:MAG: HEAT repeat domain-containing protein [Myxococcales bacterium]|nr:HEAT repeat domain-containing protein [Myxococcales bacterium]
MRGGALFPVLCLALAPVLGSSGAAALGPSPRSGGDAARSPALPGDAVKRLKSGDEAKIRSALDDVRISARAGAPAVPAIVEILERGASPQVSQAAIDTLGDTEVEGASPVLASYAHHRDVALRRSAVQALAHTRGVVAIKALRAALSDPDPAVRGLSATGLGTLKAKEAVGDLFLALDHRVNEASPSIGKLCAGAECERLAGKLGSVPFDVVTGGLDQALSRPPPDVTEDIKINIVARVRELGTGQANKFLREEQAKWPKKGSARVRQALDQAVLATSGSPGSPGTQGAAP